MQQHMDLLTPSGSYAVHTYVYPLQGEPPGMLGSQKGWQSLFQSSISLFVCLHLGWAPLLSLVGFEVSPVHPAPFACQLRPPLLT